MPPFIYINGYPGVGKLTVAKELWFVITYRADVETRLSCVGIETDTVNCSKLIPGSKVLDNHLLIDPVAAVFERDMEEYRPLRQVLRREVLKAIATSTSTRDITWIFTDSQSLDPVGISCARDYQHAATVRGSTFISVILKCDLDENLKRAVAEGRGGGFNNTKLTDVELLRGIREGEDIFRFGGEWELELDVTKMTAVGAAEAIFRFVGRGQREV